MIALGTRVSFSEIAYMVRKRRVWYVPKRGNFVVPLVSANENELRFPFDEAPARWLHTLSANTNKGIVAIPSKGSGIVIGMERKQYGHSEGGSADDGGYFDPRGHVDLYVVKSELRGKAFYVPTESLEVIA